MGNCLRPQSVQQRQAAHEDDGWEWEASAPEPEMSGGGREKGKKSQEVKIKITRKQLEELLGRVDDVKVLTVEQVLVYLMDGRDRFEENQTSWRPVLQSIPE